MSSATLSPLQVPPVFIYGQEVLRGVAKAIPQSYPISVLESHAAMLIAATTTAISAPQISLPLRMFVISTDMCPSELSAYDNSGFVLFINPVISGESGSQPACEGCLSFPGYNSDLSGAQVTVNRPNSFSYTYQTITNGALATVTQTEYSYDSNGTEFYWVFPHEVDHLNGILFIDYCGTLSSQNETYLANIKAGIYPGDTSTTLATTLPITKG
jgi:peptide deformylase